MFYFFKFILRHLRKLANYANKCFLINNIIYKCKTKKKFRNINVNKKKKTIPKAMYMFVGIYYPFVVVKSALINFN